MSNRFHFLGADTDANGKEFVYILDTSTGDTLKSPVRGMSPDKKEPAGVFVAPEVKTEPVNTETKAKVEHDPTGDLVPPGTRKLGRKVPPAFLGNIDKMHMDPGKTGGVTDIILPK